MLKSKATRKCHKLQYLKKPPESDWRCKSGPRDSHIKVSNCNLLYKVYCWHSVRCCGSVCNRRTEACNRQGEKSVRISAWVVGICWLLHSMYALFMWSKCLSESEIGSVTLFCILSVKLVDHFKSGLNVESTIRAGTACATNVQT